MCYCFNIVIYIFFLKCFILFLYCVCIAFILQVPLFIPPIVYIYIYTCPNIIFNLPYYPKFTIYSIFIIYLLFITYIYIHISIYKNI